MYMFIKNEFTFQRRDDISLFNESIESVFIELSIAKSKIIVGVVYRPPNSSINDFSNIINDILTTANNEKKQCYVMGDFNIDILKHNSTDFVNTIYSNNFFPLIIKPTRVNLTSSSLIDNIFTNVSNYKISSGVLVTDLTDHFPIFCKCHISHHNNSNSSKSRSFSNANISNFNSRVALVDWIPVLNDNNANSSYNSFCNILTMLYNDCFPFIRPNNNKRKKHPWITSGILTSIKHKNNLKLFKMYLKNPVDTNKAKYSKYRNKLNHILRIAKKNYFSRKFQETQNDSKSTWSIINNLLNKNKPRPSIVGNFKVPDNSFPDPLKIANDFNNYFIQIGPTLSKNILSNSHAENHLNDKTFNPSSLFLFPTSEEEIVKVASHCL